VKTFRNIALGAVIAVLGIGAAFAHGQGQHGRSGCHAGGERHEQPKDEKHEHDRR
jgi:hypothetical protein